MVENALRALRRKTSMMAADSTFYDEAHKLIAVQDGNKRTTQSVSSPDKILNVDRSQGKIVNGLDDALTIGCARRFKKAFGAAFFDQLTLVH